MLRLFALVVIAAAAVFLIESIGGEPVHRLQTPVLRAAPTIAQPTQPQTGSAGEVEAATGEEFADIRIGSFERPEDVPGYEILEETQTGSAGTRSARLLVDTRAHSQEDFTLITRDLKARYADYDFVSVEFTDTSVVLDYQGGAVIVNTPLGASRAGFIFAPPNEGYYVRAEE